MWHKCTFSRDNMLRGRTRSTVLRYAKPFRTRICSREKTVINIGRFTKRRRPERIVYKYYHAPYTAGRRACAASRPDVIIIMSSLHCEKKSGPWRKKLCAPTIFNDLAVGPKSVVAASAAADLEIKRSAAGNSFDSQRRTTIAKRLE